MTIDVCPTTTATTRPAGKPWTLPEAADFLGVHLRTLRRAIDMNKAKPIRFGRKVMLSDATVRKLAEEGIR
jgi:excisionase family DNA binding protein